MKAYAKQVAPDRFRSRFGSGKKTRQCKCCIPRKNLIHQYVKGAFRKQLQRELDNEVSESV